MVDALGQRGEHRTAMPASPAAPRNRLEERRRDVVRAGEGRENPARREEAKTAEVDLLVTSRRRLDGVLPPREGRRVEDDEAEPLLRRLEPAERVEGVVVVQLRPVGESVQLEVACAPSSPSADDSISRAPVAPAASAAQANAPV